jgi:membrane-bound serine protease (ClpP class)
MVLASPEALCRTALSVLGAMVIALSAVAAHAQEPKARPRDGLFISVPNPITDNELNRIEQKIKKAFEQERRRIRVVVFDFNPNNVPSGTIRPASCTALAYYIRDLRLGRVANLPQVNTVAFVHNEVSRHTVLPVLACGELIMSSGARIGDALRDAGALDPSTAAAYKDIAKGSPAPDLVLKMIDPDLEIHKVRTRDGVRYLDKKKLDRLLQEKDKGGVLADEGVPPGLESPALVLDTPLARRFGLCKETYETREDVNRALRLPQRSLEEDFLVGRVVVPWRIEVRGVINKAKLDSLERRIKSAIAHGANLLILQLDGEGGETVDAAAFAQGLRNLKDDSGNLPVTTVAYIPPGRVIGAGTYLALGCSKILMARSAVLGDFDYLKAQPPEALAAKRDMLVRLAAARGYPQELFQAMLDPQVVLYRVRSKTDPGDVPRVLSEDELNRDRRSAQPQWVEEGRIAKMPGEFLKLDAALAYEFGVAAQDDVDTPEALYAACNVDAAKVRVARDDWLDKVAEFFREPLVNVLLIMIGIAGLILELKIPGIGFPGVIAAVCFVLFFWAHSFVGQFTMLAVLLFVLGLILIGLEIFVLPGFGVTGISGIVLLVGSLVLVTLERMPETTQDWVGLGTRISAFGISLVAAIVAAFVLAWYLPHLPYAGRLVLEPPSEEEEADPDPLGPTPDSRTGLLGAIGVAATTLRPAGKARFGDDYLDVIAEGDYVNAGSRVQVIELEGNRIVVKEV